MTSNVIGQRLPPCFIEDVIKKKVAQAKVILLPYIILLCIYRYHVRMPRINEGWNRSWKANMEDWQVSTGSQHTTCADEYLGKKINDPAASK